MSIFQRLFGTPDRTDLRPLWHDTVATSREPEWYAQCGVDDTVDGRFDMISLILSLVLLRMERSEALAPKTGPLTELFVADMDRQLRDTGVGDLKVGKNIGLLMEALGGRLAVLRNTLGDADDAPLAEALQRNIRLVEDGVPMKLAARVRALDAELSQRSDDQLLAGEIRA